MSIYLVIGIVIFAVFVFFFQRQFYFGKENLKTSVDSLFEDYYSAHVEVDLEKRKLRFHKLVVSTDRVLSHLLAYYGCKSSKVKQQLSIALQRNILLYDQYKLAKRFHHLRNEVVHDGLEINGENENKVYGVLTVMKALIG